MDSNKHEKHEINIESLDQADEWEEEKNPPRTPSPEPDMYALVKSIKQWNSDEWEMYEWHNYTHVGEWAHDGPLIICNFFDTYKDFEKALDKVRQRFRKAHPGTAFWVGLEINNVPMRTMINIGDV